jgi:hypothetical protein
MATRKDLEESTENLEPQIDDPDVEVQEEMVSGVLRVSSLRRTFSTEQRHEIQEKLYVNELPNCNINQDDDVTLISDAVANIDWHNLYCPQ